MKAIAIQNRFGLDSLQPLDLPTPTPGPGQVLVRVKAASLNYRDLMTVTGHYNPKQPLPLVPLSDGAGDVVAVGEGVERVKVGDRVAGTFFQNWVSGAPSKQAGWSSLGGPLPGMLAEYALLQGDGVVSLPKHLSYEEAATLPCAALTAWNALVVQGQVKAGDSVLVQGTGGVSIFALQFALLAGARVIITSSSDAKLERAKTLGAHETINYRTTPEWDKRVLELTDGQGVNHVVEVGGAGTLPKSLNAAAYEGHVSIIGVLTGVTAQDFDVIPILRKSLHVQGIYVGSREMFEEMNRAIALHKLKPVIDRTFAFTESQAAISTLEGASHFGKIVIRIGE